MRCPVTSSHHDRQRRAVLVLADQCVANQVPWLAGIEDFPSSRVIELSAPASRAARAGLSDLRCSAPMSAG
jgi:hypothetical protein